MNKARLRKNKKHLSAFLALAIAVTSLAPIVTYAENGEVDVTESITGETNKEFRVIFKSNGVEVEGLTYDKTVTAKGNATEVDADDAIDLVSFIKAKGYKATSTKFPIENGKIVVSVDSEVANPSKATKEVEVTFTDGSKTVGTAKVTVEDEAASVEKAVIAGQLPEGYFLNENNTYSIVDKDGKNTVSVKVQVKNDVPVKPSEDGDKEYARIMKDIEETEELIDKYEDYTTTKGDKVKVDNKMLARRINKISEEVLGIDDQGSALKDIVTVGQFNTLRTNISSLSETYYRRVEISELGNKMNEDVEKYTNFTKSNGVKFVGLRGNKISTKSYTGDKNSEEHKVVKIDVPEGIYEVANTYITDVFSIGYSRNRINEWRTKNPGKDASKIIEEIEKDLNEWLKGSGASERIKDIVDKLKANDELYVKIYNSGAVIDDWWNLTEEDVKEDIPWLNGTGTTIDGNEKQPDPSKINEIFAWDKALFAKFKSELNVKLVKNGANINFMKDFPQKGYVARIAVQDNATNKVILDTKTEGETVKLRNTNAKEITVGYQLYKFYDGKLGIMVDYGSQVFSMVDTKAPTLNYAYVAEGGLVVNITDESGLDPQRPILWRYDGDDKFKTLDANDGYGENYGKGKIDIDGEEIDIDFNVDDLFDEKTGNFDKYRRLDPNDYRIEMREIPEDVQIIATDIFGNRLPLQIEVDEDNKVLTRNAPRWIYDLIEKVDRVEYSNRKYDDLIMVKVDKKVNFFEAFRKIIKKEFKKFNTYDLVYTDEEGHTLDARDEEFEEPGMYRISITNSEEFGEVIAWVYVIEENVKSPAFKIKSDFEVQGREFQAVEALDLAGKSKKLPTQIIASDDDRYYTLEDKIEFEKDKDTKRIRIIDLDKSKKTTVDVKTTGLGGDDFDSLFPVGKQPTPNDIVGHWSQSYAQNMLDRELMYTFDGSFGPNSVVSVRELLSTVGRIGMKNPTSVKGVVNGAKERKYTTVTGTGAEQIKFALDRMPIDIFENANLDTEITREESAYVMANFFQLKPRGAQVQLTDIDSSPYKQEINLLVNTGAISGNPDGSFRPAIAITRAEEAKILSSLV